MSPDLSLTHQPVSDLFPHMSVEEAWEAFHLSEEQVSFFNENGYLSGIQILDGRQVDQLRQELADIADPKHPQHDLFY